MTVNYLFKNISRNKKNKKTKNRRKKQIELTRKSHKPYKQYKKIFKGGFPPHYAEVLKKYYYIFDELIFDAILETKIFNNPTHIDTLIRYLNEKTKNATSKTLDNKSQVTEILIPALTQFVDNVVRKNQSEESKLIRGLLLITYTKTILNTLLGPKTIQKILEKSPPDKLIETFISDLEILKMNPEDKAKAKAEAKAEVKAEAAPVTAEPVKKTPTESSSEKNKRQKNKENTHKNNSDEHFGIMAAKPKSRRPLIRRKKRETTRRR